MHSSAFALLRLLTWPYVRRHLLRYALVICGVSLAVGVWVSMHLAKDSVGSAFRRATDQLSGSAQLQISSGEGGVEEGALEKAAAVGCVDGAAALISRTLSTSLPGEAAIWVLGVDLLEDSRFREYRLEPRGAAIDDGLSLLAQPDSVLITRQFAERNRLRIGSQLPVWTGRERRLLRVRGLLDSSGIARAFSGNLAVMDVYAAQHTFGRRGLFDRIDIAVRDGESVDSCRAAIAVSEGPAVRVERPSANAGSLETLSKSYLLLVDSFALLGMMVAMFLIHHASSTSVAEREHEIGIVLGLGGDERDILRMVLVESAVAGLAAGLAGLLVGRVAAGKLSILMAKVVEMFGVAVVPDRGSLEATWALSALALVAFLSAVSSLTPARAAAAVRPIQLIEGRSYATERVLTDRAAALIAASLAITTIVIQQWSGGVKILYFTLPMVAVTLWFAGQSVSTILFRSMRLPFARAWAFEGGLAIDALIRTGRRSRGTLLGLSFTVATVLAISGVTAGYMRGYHEWATRLVAADFLIHSAPQPAARGELFPATVGDRLRKVDGVAEVLPVRRIETTAAGIRAQVTAINLAGWSARAGLAPPANGRCVVISRNFANLSHRSTGDWFRIDTPAGPLAVRIQAIVDDYANEAGSVYLDWAVYQKMFRDDLAEMFFVYLERGADRASVRTAIPGRFDPGAPVLILDGREFRDYLERLMNQWRALSFVQTLVALVISLLGTASFLIVSVADRRREFGILATLGATPSQIARCMGVEALGMGVAAVLLGCTMGAFLQHYLLFTLRNSVSGFELPWCFDQPLALALAIVVPASTLLAAAVPAASLMRIPLEREVRIE